MIRKEFSIWEVEGNLLFFLETTRSRTGDSLDTTQSLQCRPALGQGPSFSHVFKEAGGGEHYCSAAWLWLAHTGPQTTPTLQWTEGSTSGLDAGQQSPCLSLPLTSFDHFYSR